MTGESQGYYALHDQKHDILYSWDNFITQNPEILPVLLNDEKYVDVRFLHDGEVFHLYLR